MYLLKNKDSREDWRKIMLLATQRQLEPLCTGGRKMTCLEEHQRDSGCGD